MIEEIWAIYNNTYNDANRFEEDESELAVRILCDVQEVIENHVDCGDGWIPCKEELPSIDGDYEATVDRDVDGEKINVTEFQYFRSDRGKWESYKNSRFERNVIAWRYNTEPYRPE